jgi:membrane-associated progesterone receptor component
MIHQSEGTGDRVNLSTKEKEEAPADPPRNFTQQQLRHFDGHDNKPVYLSISGIVFDVSKGRDFYGPGGPYEKFAGRECGVALSKMSFDEEHLDDFDGTDKLNFGEKAELEGWIDKFTNYRCYPVKGRLISNSKMPDPSRSVTAEELTQSNGKQPVPDGYAAAPILIGAGDKVFDMSFGGVSFYGSGGPYEKFAGRDASRALAKMSLDEADITSSDLSDVTEKQLATMNDWIKTFTEKKSYPLVGKLVK